MIYPLNLTETEQIVRKSALDELDGRQLIDGFGFFQNEGERRYKLVGGAFVWFGVGGLDTDTFILFYRTLFLSELVELLRE